MAEERRFHLQRLMILAAIAIVAVGYFVPWAELGAGPEHVNALDHRWFRVPLVLFALAIVALALVGQRSARVHGPALGTIVILALAIAAIAAVVAYSLASSKVWAWTLRAGPFLTLLGSILVAIFGLAIGRPQAPSVGSELSRWNRPGGG